MHGCSCAHCVAQPPRPILSSSCLLTHMSVVAVPTPFLAAQASDRLLLITEALTSTGPASFLAAGMGSLDPSEGAAGSSSDLHAHHVLLPAAYLAANWPLQHVAVSPCGSDIAAAGMRGVVVYNRKQERWRMFGEVLQVRVMPWGRHLAAG